MSEKIIKILDLYCGAGGASMGYFIACNTNHVKTEITGIDIISQPNYPFNFIQDDSISFFLKNFNSFDFIHASPPCQLYSHSTSFHKRSGKQYSSDLIDIRKLLYDSKLPALIENVQNSPLRKDIVLSGYMFNLQLIKTRVFELINFFLLYSPRFKRIGTVKAGDYAQVVGKGQKKVSNGLNFKISGNSVNEIWSNACKINWMSNIELAQSIPPVYTSYIFDLYIKNYLSYLL